MRQKKKKEGEEKLEREHGLLEKDHLSEETESVQPWQWKKREPNFNSLQKDREGLAASLRSWGKGKEPPAVLWGRWRKRMCLPQAAKSPISEKRRRRDRLYAACRNMAVLDMRSMWEKIGTPFPEKES